MYSLYNYLDDKKISQYILLMVLITGTILHVAMLPSVTVISNKLTYLHYDYVEFKLAGVKESDIKQYSAKVYKDSEPVATIGKQSIIGFSAEGTGKFPVPWGAQNGMYKIKLFKNSEESGQEDIFYIKTRKPLHDFSEPLKIIDLESAKRLSRFRIKGPDGIRGGYEKIYDWMRYIGADTLWYMAGQTASYKKDDIKRDYPWLADNLKTIEEFANKTHENKMNFGGWISCYRVFGNKKIKPEWYSYSYKYKWSKERIYETDGISINDKKRLQDIIGLAKELSAMENIDYIGLDYIRPAGGSLDLVDDFVTSMDIETPGNWNSLPKNQKMKWLAQIVTRSKNRNVPIIDKWNWWRARRMALIIRQIKESIDPKKPLWAFVLSWELGHQHGQDPIMFQDAGIDLVSVMMYEADAPRFDHIVDEWRDYLDGFDVNVAVGNQIDWVLHQCSIEPSGPAEYTRRLDKSVDNMKEINSLKGVFIHDFSRAMWGRLGPYSSNEWMHAISKTFSRMDEEPVLGVEINITDIVNSQEKTFGDLVIKNNSKKTLENIKITFPDIKGIVVRIQDNDIDKINASEELRLPFSVKINEDKANRMGRYMIPVRVEYNGKISNASKYVWVRGIMDKGSLYR